jgi:hypothetical protein
VWACVGSGIGGCADGGASAGARVGIGVGVDVDVDMDVDVKVVAEFWCVGMMSGMDQHMDSGGGAQGRD